jgi:hypothetical protein
MRLRRWLRARNAACPAGRRPDGEFDGPVDRAPDPLPERLAEGEAPRDGPPARDLPDGRPSLTAHLRQHRKVAWGQRRGLRANPSDVSIHGR